MRNLITERLEELAEKGNISKTLTRWKTFYALFFSFTGKDWDEVASFDKLTDEQLLSMYECVLGSYWKQM